MTLQALQMQIFLYFKIMSLFFNTFFDIKIYFKIKNVAFRRFMQQATTLKTLSIKQISANVKVEWDFQAF